MRRLHYCGKAEEHGVENALVSGFVREEDLHRPSSLSWPYSTTLE
jgi:hypothetical protein